MSNDQVEGILCPFMSRQQPNANQQSGYYLNVVNCWKDKCGCWSPVFKCCGVSLGGLREGRH